MQWAMVASKRLKVNLRDFADWLEEIATAASLITTNRINLFEDKNIKENHKKGDKKKHHNDVCLNNNEPSPNENVCQFCKKPFHKIIKCREFLKLDEMARWQKVASLQLCFSCLKPGHRSPDCPQKIVCGVDKCTRKHHPLLHKVKRTPEIVAAIQQKENKTEASSTSSNSQSKASSTTIEAWCGHTEHKSGVKKVYLRILPVILNGPSGSLSTYALLDEGSTVPLIDSRVASRLGLGGPIDPLLICGWNQDSHQNNDDSQRVQVSIAEVHQNAKTFKLHGVRTVKNMDLPVQFLNMEKIKAEYPYLSEIPFDSLKGAQPTILIGQDNLVLTLPRKSVHKSWNDPLATKSWLGWAVHGNSPLGGRVDGHYSFYLCETNESLQLLHQKVKDSFSTENFGVMVVDANLRSREDKRAIQMMEETTIRLGERFETGLLWKLENPSFPESRSMALQRLGFVERKMDKDPQYAQQYCAKIEDMVSKGYARKVAPEKLKNESSKVWYLPHFSVVNPNKPGKLRVVLDAAAKSYGISYNSMMVTGPDLLKPIVAILWKFRQKKIAFTADIQEMFPQILIREEDLDCQRFLWRGMSRSMEPEVYEHKSMIFGAACSPASAIYVKNKNAEEFKGEFPKVYESCVTRMYMDDLMESIDTEQEAIEHIKNIIEVHRRGGFRICNWTCNSKAVLATLPVDFRANGYKDLSVDSHLPTERVLGMYWNSETDVFTFKLKLFKVKEDIRNGSRKPTKKEVLSLVMSIYDPIGFVIHLLIKARILLQDIWKLGIGWEDEISDELFSRWKLWLAELQGITSINIPRCYSESLTTATSTQLHVFCDASSKAFATVAFLRIQSENALKVVFIAARAKVAPLKLMSIPRLELQAAVMGSRLAKTIQEEHEFDFHQIYLWTDSRTILWWLRSYSKRFKQFVGHRVGEIQELTDVSSWRWVPTNDNVADDATRDSKPSDISSESRWFNGPEFLYLSEDKWPVESETDLSEVQEMKSEFVGNINSPSRFPLPDIGRFSKWTRLIRVTAWIIRFLKMYRYHLRKIKPPKCGNLTVQELNFAEKIWIKHVQQKHFGEEVCLLKQSKSIPASSRLFKLSPMLDDMGCLRVSGRLNEAELDEFVKNPFVLTTNHYFTKLLVEHFHELMAHQGQQTILNELKKKYWILKVGAFVRKICLECQHCKVQKCSPCIPQMGQLPKCRVTPQIRPFVHTGIDFFGPLEVKVRKIKEKMYGVIFSCLTTRAIHLELSSSLSTDGTIMAMRRFIARRGKPQVLYSDNSTNFRGAERELRQSVQDLDQEKIQNTLSAQGINWLFNPPAAPHFGGSWESLIRPVKTALRMTLKGIVPTEEVLHTLLLEAEHIVNSRPLTNVSCDIDDPICLTPNHFLILSANFVLSPCNFSDRDICLRKEWQICQRLCDHFWSRWVKEYLPTLLVRTKWLQRTKAVKVGDVVILVDSSGPWNRWPMGRIARIYTGKDGVVRVVDVKIGDGVYRRPLTKLCILDTTQATDVP